MNATQIFLVTALSVWLTPSFGATATATGKAARTVPADQGMVIRGDQEAPLVLYIVPWQEPKALELPLPLIPLLPQVFDGERSLIADPAHRSIDPKRLKNE